MSSVLEQLGYQERAVVRVDQSPMNRKQWCIELSCGHEFWMTATKRPARKSCRCSKCPRLSPQGPAQHD